MMRKLGGFAAIAVTATLIATLLPLAGAGAQGGRTLKYSAPYRELQQTEVDATGDGDLGAGDYFVGGFVLRRGGRARGHVEFRCDIVTTNPERELCHAVAHIDGFGELVLDDVSNAGKLTQKVAITGGTGQFGDASGNAFLDFRGSNRAYFTFHVR
jgi:hypothetical protein